MRTCLARVVLGLVFSALTAVALPSVGPQSPAVDLSRYAVVRYVDAQRGSDTSGDGSREKPWASLPHALEQTGVVTPARRAALLVSAGRYVQPTFALKPHVDLYGGFANPGGARDVYRHASILDGEETHRIAFGADDARLDGFQLVRGRVRGKGAALYCDGVAPVVANCIFAQNRTQVPERWAPAELHETAHDGGAIFCANGSALHIEQCLFSDNTTECGRGGAVAAQRAAPEIVRSVFVNNRSGLDDPMRSSDGGAVSFFDWSAGELRDCVVSANAALTRNDAGGVFVALWSSPRITGNVFTANNAGDDAGALFIGGQEHRYGRPRDAMPPPEKFHVRVERNVFAGNTNASKNSGAMRVTMESRASFHDNVIAENEGGFYLQRSEIVAERNTVWQDWRFVEDLPSLGPSRLVGNILRGPAGGKVEARATLAHNMGERIAAGADAIAVADVFENDGVTGTVTGVRYDPAAFVTIVTVAQDLPAGDALVGRPLGLAQGKTSQWRVIRSVRSREVEVWGRLEAETKPPETFAVLRSFTLRSDAPDGIGARLKPESK